MAIKKMIECRCMTWEENAMHDDLVEELLDKDPQISGRKVLQKMAPWVLETVYKVKASDFTPGEIVEIYTRTKELTAHVRAEEIKKLEALVVWQRERAGYCRDCRKIQKVKQTLDCNTCAYRAPELMEGNREAYAAWYAIRNCRRYAVGMTGAILLGISWQDADYILNKYGFRVSALMMQKLQKLEDLEIENSLRKEGK